MQKVPAFFWLSLGVLFSLPIYAAQTEARLTLAAEAARPGETIMAAVELRMEPHWHTYWKNAGDVGIPTTIEWTLPKGVTAGEILWPIPEKYSAGDQTQYIYNHQVFLLIPLSLAADSPNGQVELKAKVAWLECEEMGLCVPGKANIAATLTIGPASQPSKEAAAIEAWQKRLPQRRKDFDARASWEQPAAGDSRALVIEWTQLTQAEKADFFPGPSEDFLVKPSTEQLKAESRKARLRVVVEKLSGDWPKEISGLLVEGRDKSASATEVTLPIAGANRIVAAVTGKKLWGMLGLAFLGGLILNIMPCVLPVIALKILGFVHQAQESPGQVRKLGLIYTVGVLFSFAVLAGVVIGLQQAGRAASWGMQFQNPAFLVAMTILVALVAMNLFGLFEINLGGSAMGAAGELAARSGAVGAFFNGVLATALATPCTAPFLAVALGFAFAQPSTIILLIFLLAGFGLAAPYLILSFQPKWLRFLPKPGAWMEKFKVLMGFPMLATAVWLFTLTSAHFGKSGTLWFGFFLVALAVAAWVWGEFVQRGTQRRPLAMAISVVLVIGFGAYVLKRAPDQIQWQPWSLAAVEKARAEGHPVFVDFTADWCVTCQANKRTSIEIPAVRAKLKELNAVALLADYTRYDDAITAELKRYERAGVPLVLVYPKNPASAPAVLPTVLTPSIVLQALDRAANEGKRESDRPKEVQKNALKTK
jgi:thiol:disulfide interchange protein DsbD